jgi:transcriptional activator for dhaKLM operon
LIAHVLAASAPQGAPLTVHPSALKALCAYPWPGNVRELEAVIDQCIANCDGPQILLEHLPDAVRAPRAKVPNRPATEPVRSFSEAERAAILAAGRAAHGNLSRAAQLLGIGRTTLWRRMREMELKVEDFE